VSSFQNTNSFSPIALPASKPGRHWSTGHWSPQYRRTDGRRRREGETVLTELQAKVIDECLQLHGDTLHARYRCRLYATPGHPHLRGTNEIIKTIISKDLGL